MKDLKQSSTAQPLVFFMALSSDGKSPATGLSPTVTLSKSGGSFASPAGAVTEISNGWYKVAGNATDTNTLGPLLLNATAATADNAQKEWSVVKYDPQLNFSGTADAGATGGLPLSIDSLGRVDVRTADNVSDVDNPVDVSNAGAVAVRQEIDANSTKLDAAVSTRATQTSVDAIPTNPLTTLGTNAPAGWINAAAIAANALDSKGNWNVGKTGYALTQTFPTNFSAFSINGSGHIVLADASLTTAKLGTFALAKTTNITGFNDIAATAIVSSGPITTLAGAVVNVTNVTGSIPAGATPPTAAEIDAQLSGTHGSGLWGGAAGSGAFTIIQNVKTSLGANMQGVTVTMYDGSNYYTALTNASGNATFSLDAATYTQTAYYPGYTITNNGSVVVTANATLTGIVGTANSITPPVDPSDCTLYFVAKSAGLVLPGAVFTLRCTQAPTGTGNGYVGDTRTATSASNGVVSVSPAVPQTSEWDMRSPNGTVIHIVVPSASTYLVPNFNA